MLDDPWIKVRYVDGRRATLGVYDCLKDARDIKEILCPGNVHMETYAVHRFLIALLVDAYKVRNMRQVRSLFEKGLDMDTLETYRSEYEKNGFSFDVFDKYRPFMQVPVGQVPKNLKTVPVATLGYGKKSGNNDLFYRLRERNLIKDAKTYQSAQTMEIEEYIAMILTVHFCAVASGAGYSASVPTVGQPPMWFLNKGKNLYETLFLSMYPTSDDDVPMWRKANYLEKVEDVSGWLSLAFHPVRFVAPGDGFDGKTVKNVKFGRIQFNQMKDTVPHPSNLLGLWSKYEPFVAICTRTNQKTGESETRPLRYNRNSAMWMCTYELYGCTWENVVSFNSAAPLIMNTAKMFSERGIPSTQSIYVLTLTTQTEKEPCQAVFDHFMSTAEWMFDDEAKELIRDFVEFTKKVGGRFVSIVSEKGGVVKSVESAELMKRTVFNEAGRYLVDVLLPNISTMEREDAFDFVSDAFMGMVKGIETERAVEKYSAYTHLGNAINKILKDYTTEEEETA